MALMKMAFLRLGLIVALGIRLGFAPVCAQGNLKAALRSRPSPTFPTRATTMTAELDLNNASQSDLVRLLGIDEAQAKQIITGRPYKEKHELVSRNIISTSTYISIQNKVKVNGATK
jgi:DNA uptake protein ComE-like DNA-binding protein